MKTKGFTLIELVVVMAIIAILSAMTAPSFLSYRKKSQLLLASQLLESGFSEGFSSARSRPMFFFLDGKNDDDNFEIWECASVIENENEDEPPLPQGCTLIQQQFFEGSVSLSQDVSVIFAPPFGDILYLPQAPSIFRVTNGDGDTRSIQLYKNSGLSGPVTTSQE